jgi:hypothetical protein
MTGKDELSLTGVWHGLYTYCSHPHLPESHFICVLIDNGGRLSGSIHETMNRLRDTPVEAFAFVDGAHCGNHVTFLMTYDGTGGQTHGVSYAGTISDDREEIEGEWRIDGRYGTFSGNFLMIRKRGSDAAAEAGAEIHVETH